MRKYLSVVLVVCVFLALFSSCDFQKKNETPSLNELEAQVKESNPAFLEIPAPSIANNILGEADVQSIGVYLPPSYFTQNREFPVLYFLPGFHSNYKDYVKELASALERSIPQGTTEMIAVVVNDRSKLQGSLYVNSPVTGNWEDYVLNDVIPYVDANFRTLKAPKGRGIAGQTVGGTAALNMAMHTKGVFGYIYCMSPGVFDENGLEDAPVHFNVLADLQKEYAGKSKEEASEAYKAYINTLQWPVNFTFAYATVFAGDPSLKAPYIKMPQIDEDGKVIKDANWQLLQSGFGDITEKLNKYEDNLRDLKAIGLDYAAQDRLVYIRNGTEYLSKELKARNINHSLEVYDGAHQDHVMTRLREVVLPFFAEQFTRG
ncbi:MAG: esterase family protein [Oscillospiraceae bacterium]|jgi:enterochelin esterase-like enzyme|nr:esterase family protein [Oscillospiraceae bacterium]